MSRIIDISTGLHPALARWPGTKPLAVDRVATVEEHGFAASDFAMHIHYGTHVDAPSHFVAGGETVDNLDLDVLVGPARVVDVGDVDIITASVLTSLGLPPTRRLLVRTNNAARWPGGFDEDFVAFSEDGARWLVDHGVQLVGVDYMSVQRYHDGPEVHLILLGAGVVVIEGLQLSHVEPGEYDLACLPLKLVGLEAAPARAVLRPLGTAAGATETATTTTGTTTQTTGTTTETETTGTTTETETTT